MCTDYKHEAWQMLKWLQYTASAASDVINLLATLVGAFMETQDKNSLGTQQP